MSRCLARDLGFRGPLYQEREDVAFAGGSKTVGFGFRLELGLFLCFQALGCVLGSGVASVGHDIAAFLSSFIFVCMVAGRK